jgi:DNA/RNA-binding domain of Phe-tRNA-synthetase-like protein
MILILQLFTLLITKLSNIIGGLCAKQAMAYKIPIHIKNVDELFGEEEVMMARSSTTMATLLTNRQ